MTPDDGPRTAIVMDAEMGPLTGGQPPPGALVPCLLVMDVPDDLLAILRAPDGNKTHSAVDAAMVLVAPETP